MKHAKKKSKKTIINILLSISLFILTISLLVYHTVQENYKQKCNELLNKEIKKEVNTGVKSDISFTNDDEEISIPSPEELERNRDSIDNYTTIGILEIPSLNIKYPIISETTNKALRISVTKYWGSNPNEVGNMVILGHNYNNSSYMLSKLPNINIGDEIRITDNSGQTLSYIVYETNVIDPYNNECTSQLTDGRTEVTVITCVDNGDNRFYAKARVE